MPLATELGIFAACFFVEGDGNSINSSFQFPQGFPLMELLQRGASSLSDSQKVTEVAPLGEGGDGMKDTWVTHGSPSTSQKTPARPRMHPALRKGHVTVSVQ